MKHFFSSELQPTGIDERNGVIRGAVACQAGLEARGHSLRTDRILLNQLLVSAKAKGDKVPVHLDHRSGAAGCIGTARNFRLDGDKLRCDLHLFRSHDKYAQTMEMLSNLYETAGLSASFVGDAENGMARCKDLLAVDIVIHPAAVATGLFSAMDGDSDSEHYEDTIMDQPIDTDESLDDQLAEILHHLMDRVEALEEENAQLREALEDRDDDDVNEEETEECPLEETGIRAGPFRQDHASALRTHDFESRIQHFQASGKSAKEAHILALKEFARSRYQTLNL